MLLKEFIDISKLNKLKPASGRVLISEPFMDDENFSRSVIYLCEYNEDESYGFILNHILNPSLSELINEIDNKDFSISYGGPVSSDNLFYFHNLGARINGSKQLSENLWTGGDFNEITSLINNREISENNIRFFLGYSGWSKSQLSNEMKSNSWIVSEIEQSSIISIDQNLWQSILSEKGGKYKIVSNFPIDPTSN
ncbi:MAG: YqgE/AlgH family protein [Flavobacteriales bacterium]|nr:YqgE/AlgH family protein [Flavobacteriales bacterium]